MASYKITNNISTQLNQSQKQNWVQLFKTNEIVISNMSIFLLKKCEKLLTFFFSTKISV